MSSRAEQHQEAARRQFRDRYDDPERRERMRPVALDKLCREEMCNRAIMDALMEHFHHSVCTGRLDVWAKAAHAAIDLMACDGDAFVKRSDFPS